ncbi:McrB family protein [Geomonas subterranea]|uniref:McrB family protein n=1 Tax=Geomonas subterranea TaxID=2847989 RepID=UPI001CD7BC67|nr:hypothetical protein [Geomonas fuzhouensis]
MQALAANRLNELYEKFRRLSPWKDWYESFVSEIGYFKGLPDEEFTTPEQQEKLWRARGVSSIGPGESLNVKGAYSDQAIVNEVLLLRKKVLPEDTSRRAKLIKESYDVILKLVQKHSTQRPFAKQSRLFTVLHPEELHTCYQWKARMRLQELVLGTKKYSFAEGAVLVRARLREILGKEADLEENVWRCMFCWWLNEQYDAIQRGDEVVTDTAAVSAVDGEDSPVEVLEIWPAPKQRKGLQAIANYHDALRMVITAARGGASPDDVVDTMKDNAEFSGYKANTCRVIFNLVRTFGFLENRDGLWYPSDEGEQLVEDDPADVLVEKLLVQVYGMAHFIKAVGENQPVPKKQIYDFLKGLWGGWTSDFMPSALAAWLRAMGLLTLDISGCYLLTDYGNYWCSRLPAKEDIPIAPAPLPAVEVGTTEEGTSGTELSGLQGLPFEQLWQVFESDDTLKGFVFKREQVEALHLAWHCNPQKRFVLLSGLSGTGKTALLFHYARLYCQLKGVNVKDHRAVIAVSPEWRDPSGLLGYFNALHADPTFQAEPALRTVIAASQNPNSPYFLILDEMNLARVERYFAPFLSSMETGERLLLHGHDDTVNDVPPSIPWPKNLFVGGTVNMDETTHPFSDKVLDRAFTLEFWEVQLERYLKDRPTTLIAACKVKVDSLLLDLNCHLYKIRRHFGYRTAGEVLGFIETAEGIAGHEDAKFCNLIDQAVFSKVLPRLRGEDSPSLVQVLKELHLLCTENSLVQCAGKLAGMQERLKATGVTRFWS